MKDSHLHYKNKPICSYYPYFVWDISIIVLEIVYENFSEKVILGITKVMTFRVSFSTEIGAKNGSKYCVNKQQ